MGTLNAFTPATAQNLQLDAGILVTGLADPSKFTGTLSTPAKTMGATSGGGSFTAVPSIRNIFEDLDGAKGNYKDGNAIDTWDVKLTATIKEMTAENFKLALAAADTVPAATDGKYDVTSARNEIKTTDYLNNLCWLGTLNGSSEPIIIELKNVMNISGMNFTFADKATGGVELELQAHFDLAKPDEVPFKIYTPKKKA